MALYKCVSRWEFLTQDLCIDLAPCKYYLCEVISEDIDDDHKTGEKKQLEAGECLLPSLVCFSSDHKLSYGPICSICGHSIYTQHSWVLPHNHTMMISAIPSDPQ